MERSLFLNTLIERKAISWTKIFADLEKVLPYNVRLVSVRLPEVDSENAVLLDMVVGAKEVQPVLELVRNWKPRRSSDRRKFRTRCRLLKPIRIFRYHVRVTYAQKF